MKCKQIIRNKKIFLPILLVFSCYFSAFSQSFYNLQFALPDLKKISVINTLVIQYDDTDAVVRLAYFDSVQQKNIITECKFQHVYPNMNNEAGSIVYKFSQVKPIEGNSNIQFETYGFIFKTVTGTQDLQPNRIATFTSSGEILKSAEFKTNKIIAESDLNENLLNGLFLKDEPFYKNYTKAKSRGGFNWGRSIPTLHVYILADLNDAHIGVGCAEDQKKLIQFYTSVASKLKIRLDTVTIVNERYNRIGVQAALDSLKPGNDDIVVFHYTGHGFNREDPNDPYPNLFLVPYAERPTWENLKAKEQEEALRNATMGIQEIYKIIVSKGARLNCVFSDCCNTEYKLKNVPMIDDGKTKRGFLTLYPDYCKKLFIDERASFLATAVKKGEQAASNARIGSLYTDNYLQILGKYLTPAYNGAVEEVNWSAILANTTDVTKAKAPTIYNRLTKAPFNMSPFYAIEKK